MRVICALALMAVGCIATPPEVVDLERECRRKPSGALSQVDWLQEIRRCVRADGWVRERGAWVRYTVADDAMEQEIDSHLPPGSLPPPGIVRVLGWPEER